MEANLSTLLRWRVPVRSGACRTWAAVTLVVGLGMAGSWRIRAAETDLSLQTLHEFGSNPKNPRGSLALGNDGNFYGTTAFGGTNAENGVVFRITPGGAFTSLFSFDGSNGSRPLAGLVRASDGNLYGTTASGGANGDHGTVFKITPGGVFTLLFSFNGTNGSGATGRLVQGRDGNFYGTTASGGANVNHGTVFRITPGGVFSSLFSFDGRNGSGPAAGLVEGSDGSFYGTTAFGGTHNNNGTVFKITPAGVFTSLFSFSGRDGSGPAAGLAQGSNGNFYGTTEFGGDNGDNGTVFMITPGGALTTLYSFGGPDGNYPVSGLVLGSDGRFYGTTSGDRVFGGTNTFGTIFRMTPAGALSNLVVFNDRNGACPVAGLTQGNDGNFYGTTFQGGPGAGGTIFRLIEPPRITMIRASGGLVTLTWTSFIQGTYRVEYTPVLTAPSWTALVPDVVARGSTTSLTNSVAGVRARFYRVRLLP